MKKALWLLSSLAVFAVAVAAFCGAFTKVSAINDEENSKIVSRGIERAVTACYAAEGMYPPDFDYLIANYGVKIDDSIYYVDYQVFGSNVRPVVTVVKRGSLEVQSDG